MSNFEEELTELFDRYGVHLALIDDKLFLEDKFGNIAELPRICFSKTSVDHVNATVNLTS